LSALSKITPDDILIGKKLKDMRKSTGMNQDELADNMLSHASKVSLVERGMDRYNEDEIKYAKTLFGIENMPLTNSECKIFKGSLYYLRELLRLRIMDKAKDLLKKLSPAVNLEPCDPSIAWLFRLFEVTYLFVKGDMKAAEEKMRYFDDKVEKLSVEHLYYYNYNKGFLSSNHKNYNKTLEFYKQCFDLIKNNKDFKSDNEEILYYNLANFYTDLELPNRAIFFINKIFKMDIKDRTIEHDIILKILFSINCFKVGEFEEAEEILNNCLIGAKSIYNNSLVGLSILNLGLTHKYAENYDKAISYFDQALNIFDVNSEHYSWAFYFKVSCVIETREFVMSNKLIKKEKSKKNKNNTHSILLEMLGHIFEINKRMTVFNEESADYIETQAIPYLKINSYRLEAMRCCQLLEEHYEKVRKRTKSLCMGKIESNIYKEMYSIKKRREV